MEPKPNMFLARLQPNFCRQHPPAQATFSLKDDRDCVNPFIDQSDASHVKGYSGKRVPGSGDDFSSAQLGCNWSAVGVMAFTGF